MKTWNACIGLLFFSALGGMATAASTLDVSDGTAAPNIAAQPDIAGPIALTPQCTALCTGACYCRTPMPCLTAPPCAGICVPYCRTPMPCLTALPCAGICVPYCRTPMPCLCLPLAQPCNCNMPACFGGAK